MPTWYLGTRCLSCSLQEDQKKANSSLLDSSDNVARQNFRALSPWNACGLVLERLPVAAPHCSRRSNAGEAPKARLIERGITEARRSSDRQARVRHFQTSWQVSFPRELEECVETSSTVMRTHALAFSLATPRTSYTALHSSTHRRIDTRLDDT